MNLGEKIYKLRTERNLSQGELSEMLDVSRQSISKWENGGATPDLDKIIKLSEIFGITIDELVKSDNISVLQEEKAPQATTASEKPFPTRKIIGTVLLSVSAVIVFICFALDSLSGALSGILLTSPLILSGIVCFVFRKNVGLWCGWAVFFCIDMYLRVATGISRSAVLNLQVLEFYISSGSFAQIAISLLQLSAFVALTAITLLRFMKLPLEKKKLPVFFWSVYAVLKIAFAVFGASHLYREFMHVLLATANTWIYTLLASLYSWIYTGFFVAALVFTARYIYTKKNR